MTGLVKTFAKGPQGAMAGGGFPPESPSPAFFQLHPGGALPGNTALPGGGRFVEIHLPGVRFPGASLRRKAWD